MADLIVFGEDWGGLPSSTQHLISHLTKRHRVIWINSIGMRSPQLSLRDIKRVWQKMLAMLEHTGNPEQTTSEHPPPHYHQSQSYSFSPVQMGSPTEQTTFTKRH